MELFAKVLKDLREQWTQEGIVVQTSSHWPLMLIPVS